MVVRRKRRQETVPSMVEQEEDNFTVLFLGKGVDFVARLVFFVLLM